MACCLAGKNDSVLATAQHGLRERPRRPHARTLEKAVKAVEMFRRGFTLAKIGEEFVCSREWARQILKVARREKMMPDSEYYSLKGKNHYNSTQVRWQYFCDVADNIEHFNKDKFNDLKKKHWPGEIHSTERAAYAEQSCLEALVKKGSITRQEAKAMAYLLSTFKQRNVSPARLMENSSYFMSHKSLSLRDFALERNICNNDTNPASHAIKHIVLAIEFGIISPDDYALRALANFYSLFSTVRRAAPGWKYPEHRLKFVLNAHEKTGLPYSRIARFAEVPVQAVYDYKYRQNSKS
jgi:hypothetical protein